MQGFVDLLVRKYGSIGAAWKFIDADGGGTLSWVEFVAAATSVGYCGTTLPATHSISW